LSAAPHVHCIFTDGAEEALLRAIFNHRPLEHLSLSLIDLEIPLWKSVLPVLKQLPHLNRLHLDDDKLPTEHILAPFATIAFLPHVTQLCVSGGKSLLAYIRSEPGATALSNMPKLQSLEFRQAVLLDSDLVKLLDQAPASLTFLSLRKTPVKGSFLEQALERKECPLLRLRLDVPLTDASTKAARRRGVAIESMEACVAAHLDRFCKCLRLPSDW
jgi:hypothetical protein